MSTERHVRIFYNGSNQAIRIPKEFALDADEAILRKEGDRLILSPIPRQNLLEVLQSLSPVEEEFPDVDIDLLPLRDVDL
ncbi:AbrB/MazE/SpoVT family DNA-binding domain-containing protein [Candidatus Igneacidithiobacillus taiwanensis]|uniref:antitoxin n=1 Tax=Candidatus Igneacidithiobacillus taiwanensis TaxID=1945924 RepID=UPI00289E91BC|nr:AbrB/MazE/SpoVT family DNA-binding domain-containing protein [Candidatus Igneacidithiobacillus taiwanensis]